MTLAHVKFPLRLGYVVRRGGRARNAMRLGTVAVEIPHADHGSVDVVHDDPAKPLSYAVHEGDLWHRLMSAPGRPYGEAEAVAWLGRPLRGEGATQLEECLAGTPVLWEFADGDGRVRSRWGDDPLPPAALLVDDPEAGLARAVAALLARDVRFHGGEVLVRAAGPFAFITDARVGRGRLALAHFRNQLPPSAVAVRHDHAPALWEAWARTRAPGSGRMRTLPGWVSGLPRGPRNDGDVDVLANALPSALARPLAVCGSFARSRALRARANDLGDALAARSDEAGRGLLSGEEVEGTLRLCADALELMLDAGPAGLREEAGVRLAVIRGIWLPRVMERLDPSPGDAEAMEGLVP